MKKILLLGSSGMLGNEVYNTLKQKYQIIPTTRKDFDGEKICNDVSYFPDFVKQVGKVDYVINAIGVTIPNSKKNFPITFLVNSTLPHILAREYRNKLIHITTDCIYSGVDGKAPYNEFSKCSPKDIYGLSKSLGEPTNCLTIRTSIIGQGGDGTGLLDWFLKQSGTVKGYTDHLWNGITTHQFALICDRIMSLPSTPVGLYHVFSNSVSKYEMLIAFKKKFNVKCNIVPISGNPVDRRLSTIHRFNNSMRIPSFKQMIEEM